MALLLALSAKPEQLEVLLLSVTYGNVGVESCLRNVVSLFHFIAKEQEWRRQNGLPEGFETLKTSKPIVAIGATEPLGDQLMMADYFHGIDGLGGISLTHPHLTPAETWKHLFDPASKKSTTADAATAELVEDSVSLFTPSNTPAHLEIIRLLRENPPDTITIVAIGPLTNVALAAAADPETFLRVKEVVVMGGTIAEPGNVTPSAEFNTFADSIAAARVLALTSPHPLSTMPPNPPPPPPAPVSSTTPHPTHLSAYPHPLPRPLRVVLFPLDITSKHHLRRTDLHTATSPLPPGSPLSEWATAFLTSTFSKVETLHHSTPGLTLHDPLCIWYVLTQSAPGWKSVTEDIRVETAGQWTRGMMMVDRRDRNMREEAEGVEIGEVPGDTGNWLSARAGNRVVRMVESGGEFGGEMLRRVFGGGIE